MAAWYDPEPASTAPPAASPSPHYQPRFRHAARRAPTSPRKRGHGHVPAALPFWRDLAWGVAWLFFALAFLWVLVWLVILPLTEGLAR